MSYKLSTRSLTRLSTCHRDLQKVARLAIELTTVDFGITEGLRSIERQHQLKAAGKSKTLNSRHLPQIPEHAITVPLHTINHEKLSHAFDIAAYVDGKITWEWEYYEDINEAMTRAADMIGVPITWGGNWTSLRDGPHYELPWTPYTVVGIDKGRR